MTKIRPQLALALLTLALLGVGCGESLDESLADKAAVQAEKEAKNRKAIPEPKPIVAERVDPGAGEADLDTKPKVPKGEGAAPTKLIAQDLIVGDGPAVKSGDQLTVNYVGVLFSDGKEFDSSWGKGKQPFAFQLSSGSVIEGWVQGLAGMKVGGRRKLIIPASLGYGAQGSGKIPPNAALIFDVDLKKIGA